MTATRSDGDRAFALFMAAATALRVEVMTGVVLSFLWAAGAISRPVLAAAGLAMTVVAVVLGLGAFTLARHRT